MPFDQSSIEVSEQDQFFTQRAPLASASDVCVVDYALR